MGGVTAPGRKGNTQMAQVMKRGPVSGTAVRPERKKAPFLVEFYRSAVAKKWIMALTGIMLMGFVFFHMIGNLKMYLGMTPEGVYHLDEYGEFLRKLLVPILPRTVTLWLLRFGLIGAGVLHVHAAYSLTQINKKARPVAYQSKRDYVAANFASRTMRKTGIIFALFLLWHLADFTWGFVNKGFVRGEVYRNVGASLSYFPVALIYILGNLALGVHLYHGAWSLFQSLGFNRPRFNGWRRMFATGFAAIVVIGNLSFVFAWLFGILDKAV
jgi:succinate dehydrogenase / fumarate reductase, cytochrome b subunit